MAKYQDLATAAMSAVFGWESEIPAGRGPDGEESLLKVHAGDPVGSASVVYTAGVAAGGFEAGAPSGPELLFAGHMSQVELARGIRGVAATLILRDLAPVAGSVIRNLVEELGWRARTARHGFFVPPMLWAAESYSVPCVVGQEVRFEIRPALLILITEPELEFYKARGWDAFDEMMSSANPDILDVQR